VGTVYSLHLQDRFTEHLSTGLLKDLDSVGALILVAVADMDIAEDANMGECKLCGKNGEKLSLVSANHKDLGYITVCRECWTKLYDGNRMVCGSTGSGGSCPSCK